MCINKTIPKILAPVGSFESLQAAVQAKADAIYLGIELFHMRSNKKGFTFDELDSILSQAHAHSLNVYVTLNIIFFDEELHKMYEFCDICKNKRVDAIIAHDVSVLQYAKKIGLPVHISTQANITNIESIKFYAQFSDVIVLARELNLAQITAICKQIQTEKILGISGELLEIEIFVHGALCIAYSGKCSMSLATYNHSANRGKCLQVCRRKYAVSDYETNKDLTIENEYVMSPSDLCTLPFLDEIIQSGVSILKIEGRNRSPEYVLTVVNAYKTALLLINQNTYTPKQKQKLVEYVRRVYNRGFWMDGYYLGKNIDEWSKSYGSKATESKVFVGKITNYYSHKKIAQVIIQTHQITESDEIYIMGKTTGVIRHTLKNLKPTIVQKGDTATFYISQIVRKNDNVYFIKKIQNLKDNV